MPTALPLKSWAVRIGMNWWFLYRQSGLVSLENLALIPGLVGASPVQNIGAYGGATRRL